MTLSIMTTLNSNIGCFEISQSLANHTLPCWLNSNIGCFEILLSCCQIPQYPALNSNIGCFEIIDTVTNDDETTSVKQ